MSTASTLPPGSLPADDERRAWLAATGAMGVAAAAGTAVPFVASLSPSDRARALGAAVEVDIADLPPGAMRTVEWRGKPVWIVRRTPEMRAALEAENPRLADPRSLRGEQPETTRTALRSVRPDVFVAIGVCTHLGCSPIAVAAGSTHPGVGDDWPGGYYCPCHGSTFDGAGRVYANKPAPTNLEIPPHRWLSDTRVLIGEDNAA